MTPTFATAADLFGSWFADVERGEPPTRFELAEPFAGIDLRPGRLAAARPWTKDNEDVQGAITYFENQSQAGRMDYASHVKKKEPIGSGVTEAACKTIVKQRLCCSGMKWKEKGAATVLSLRCLTRTEERWAQFWRKIDRWGFPVAA